MQKKIKVTIFNEFVHEKTPGEIQRLYPNGIHGALKGYLEKNADFEIAAATLEMPENGLTDEVLDNTDVLLWWGHAHHHDVLDSVAGKVQAKVLAGMGFVPLHSSHYSKPFKLLVGTDSLLRWCDDQKEVLWTVLPSHPIAKGIPEYIVLESEEMYGEPFGIPNPDEVVFMSWFGGGNVFRSGVTFKRGNGKIFYFQPGHESNPSYHNEHILKIIENAIYWANPEFKAAYLTPENCHFPMGTLKL